MPIQTLLIIFYCTQNKNQTLYLSPQGSTVMSLRNFYHSLFFHHSTLSTLAFLPFSTLPKLVPLSLPIPSSGIFLPPSLHLEKTTLKIPSPSSLLLLYSITWFYFFFVVFITVLNYMYDVYFLDIFIFYLPI